MFLDASLITFKVMWLMGGFPSSLSSSRSRTKTSMICLCDVPVFATVFWELFISTVQTGLRANFVDWRHQNNSGMSSLFSLTNRRATEEPSSRTSAGYKPDMKPLRKSPSTGQTAALDRYSGLCVGKLTTKRGLGTKQMPNAPGDNTMGLSSLLLLCQWLVPSGNFWYQTRLLYDVLDQSRYNYHHQ